MPVVIKYVVVTPKNVSHIGDVYTMTLPSPVVGFEQFELIGSSYPCKSPYEVGADNRRLLALKGDETVINSWLAANSDMVIEKTFAEAEAIGQELQPARDYIAHKIIMEDGVIQSESDVVKHVDVFNLQAKLAQLGLV